MKNTTPTAILVETTQKAVVTATTKHATLLLGRVVQEPRYYGFDDYYYGYDDQYYGYWETVREFA